MSTLELVVSSLDEDLEAMTGGEWSAVPTDRRNAAEVLPPRPVVRPPSVSRLLWESVPKVVVGGLRVLCDGEQRGWLPCKPPLRMARDDTLIVDLRLSLAP
jgi:hypothetical protein